MNNNTIELEHIKNKKKDANKMMEEMNAIWCDISEKEDLMLAKHAKLLKIEKEIEELQKKIHVQEDEKLKNKKVE